jgi:peptidoglycan/xylan/chitin deacetylase (PgdA/CDA1 family)
VSASLTRALGAILSPAGRRARLAVFCYHQVLERKDLLRASEPTVEEFRQDLETIGRVFNVLPLPEAVERLQDGTLPSRAAAITFDDGYANNHELAAPLLERTGLPATFFIAGGAVDEGVMWNDLVIEAARTRGSQWIVDDLVELRDGGPPPEDAVRFLAWVLPRLKYRPLERRLRIAEAFFRNNTGQEPPRLMMDRGQVADLARRGFDIGGHTISHPILAQLDVEGARREIDGCRRWIEEVSGRTAVSFAYPNGIPGRDFGPEHVSMVRECGFASAVSTSWAVARPDSHPFAVPRIGPWWRLGSRLDEGLVRAYGKTWITGTEDE